MRLGLRFKPWLRRVFYVWFAFRKLTLPGFEGVPVVTVLFLYYSAIRQRSISERAAAVAFHFFTALFPGLIFLFSLIPYLPIENLEEQVVSLSKSIFSPEALPTVNESIHTLINRRKAGLLSLSLITSLFFSTNGMNGLMQAFNDSALIRESRSFWTLRGLSLSLTIILLSVAIIALGITGIPASLLESRGWEKNGIHLFQVARFLILLGLLYAFISLLLYAAPAKKMRKGFFSVGALVASLFFLLFSNIFFLFVKRFNSYHELYGVIGTIPLLLTWFYLNALALLMGFELNISIRFARIRNQKEKS